MNTVQCFDAIAMAKVYYPEATNFGVLDAIGGSWSAADTDPGCPCCGSRAWLVIWRDRTILARECFHCIRGGGRQLSLDLGDRLP